MYPIFIPSDRLDEEIQSLIDHTPALQNLDREIINDTFHKFFRFDSQECGYLIEEEPLGEFIDEIVGKGIDESILDLISEGYMKSYKDKDGNVKLELTDKGKQEYEGSQEDNNL